MSHLHGLYGAPPLDLVEPETGATQLSPLVPGSLPIESAEDLASLTMLAPAGALERRYALAQALRALAPNAPFIVLAAKDRGGSRLRKELEAFGCGVEETARRHHRICHTLRPTEPQGLNAAIAEAGPQQHGGVWTQPGVFSWDRIDPGSALLAKSLPPLAGEGADLGCGLGFLAQSVLASPKVTALSLIDIDRRAVEAARRNVQDPRAAFAWADVRAGEPGLEGLDFVVMNPPFHQGGGEDRRLGQVFIQRAAQMLHKGGALWLVSNRHLPYEAVLAAALTKVEVRAEASGYKVFEAKR
jgi:16S rRNA (guanine1207-N2)-methyltransferase